MSTIINVEQKIAYFQRIIDSIQYKDWKFMLYQNSKDGVYIRIEFKEGDETWNSRKWPISIYSTETEIVQTAFLAAKVAEEHEMREKFLYMKRAVFGPHIDVVEHWQIAEKLDIRN